MILPVQRDWTGQGNGHVLPRFSVSCRPGQCRYNQTSFRFLLSQFAVIDCQHDDIDVDDVRLAAFANQQTGIAKLVDDTGCPICSIENRLNGILLKDGLVTAGTSEFFDNVQTAFLFG